MRYQPSLSSKMAALTILTSKQYIPSLARNWLECLYELRLNHHTPWSGDFARYSLEDGQIYVHVGINWKKLDFVYAGTFYASLAKNGLPVWEHPPVTQAMLAQDALKHLPDPIRCLIQIAESANRKEES